MQALTRTTNRVFLRCADQLFSAQLGNYCDVSIFYSHRLKSVIQHMVGDLGLSFSIDDHGARVSITDNRQMIEETATRMGVKVEFHSTEQGMMAVFYKGG